MSILQYASPQARYYKSDRDIMADYDNRINIYNAALEKYKGEAGVYQGKVDAFNKTIEDYNKELEDWRTKAQAYNTAIEAWNQTDRTTPYTEWSGYVSSPGEWFKTAPVFEGGTAPVAPEDPGFSGEDVDAFVESAQARAIRRGNAAATAQQVMTAPGQYYVAGRENFGSTPEVSLAGMSGFGSSAMGFAEGGVAGLFQQYAQGGAVSAITEEALAAMRNKVINDYGFDPVDIALEEGVDPDLYLRVMYTENRGRQGPVSSAGAIGLMQLMPATAEELGVDPNNPLENARGGARYLRQQLNEFQSVPLALAAYNAGPGRVRRYGGVPPIEETRNYVAQIYGVDTGEILPSINDFYTRVPGEDPSPRPQPRPAGLGTTSYVPPSPVASEFLMSGVGSVFAQPQKQERTPLPYIPNIMRQPMEEEGEQKSGIEFYKQYAAYAPPQGQD
jgi:hypothetical protein